MFWSHFLRGFIGQSIEVDMLCDRLAGYHLCVTLVFSLVDFFMHAHGHFGQWLMKCQMAITYSKLSRHFHISFNMTNDWDQMIKTNFVAVATAFTGPLLCPNFLSTNRRLIYPIKHSHQNRNFFSSDVVWFPRQACLPPQPHQQNNSK